MPDQEKAESILLDALYSGNGPQHILDIASALINHPMILLDDANVVLAKTKGAVPIAKYLPQEGDASHAYDMHSQPSLISIGTGNKLILSAILVHDSSAAQLGIYENGLAFSPDTYKFAALLCKVLSIELRKGSDRFFNAVSAERLFMQDLLEQRLNNDEVIANRLKDLSWIPRDEFYLFVFPLRGRDFSPFMLGSIQDSICKLIPCSIFAVNEAGMIILTSVSAEQNPSPDMLRNLADYLQKVGLRGGISARYSKLYKTHYALEQAFAAIEVSGKMRSTEPLVSYDANMVFHVLDRCSWKIQLETLCMPGILRLRQYDETHTTKLTGTLRCYLDHAQDIIKTSAALNIHRNTLAYRIEKLKEIVGTEFDNGYDIMRLNLSFFVLDYIEKIG